MSQGGTEQLTKCDGYSTVRAFDVEYFHRKTSGNGDLWLTKEAWPWRELVAPERWYRNGEYTKHGVRLGFSTGHVYRMTEVDGRKRLSFVVKTSRVAQLVSSSGLLGRRQDTRGTFPSPFEEMGQLSRLRSSGADRLYLFTKRPLGIFSPGQRIPSWMLDRVAYEFSMAAARASSDAARYQPEEGMALEPERDYFTLFAWVNGFNLEELVRMGRISIGEMRDIDAEVRERMLALGFFVADHKPNHVIVRLDQHGAPRRRHGKLVAALADFELLESKVEGTPAGNSALVGSSEPERAA
ncbi:MAG: hypothetical protein QM784_04750 [Polyangiaceae bacterium]